MPLAIDFYDSTPILQISKAPLDIPSSPPTICLQVLQPQRFNDSVWRLVSALERKLGCLVGCNAYITPPNTQGLAPHHDDVELWICQTQGGAATRG